MTVSRDTRYALANHRDIQRERLALLAELLDPGSFRLLEALEVRAGMRCLEVGAGGGSVADWLCRRVGPGGFVLAANLGTTVLGERGHPNLEVCEHDVLGGPLPEGAFDLVHGRLLLACLPDPRVGLRRMLAALKPGGRLLLEEMDFISVAPVPTLHAEIRKLFTRVIGAHNTILERGRSFDPHYGRRLAGELATAGLVNMGCEGRAWIWQGGQVGGRVWQLTLVQFRDALITSGLLAPEDIDTALELCEDPLLRFISPIAMAAWGQQPRPGKPELSALARA